MANAKFLLDTGALIALSGLEGMDLQVFKDQIEASNSELSVTHIQVDEKHRTELKNYQQKIEKALASLKDKGIGIHLEPTKIVVLGVSRFGLAKFGNDEIGKIYDELRNEIDKCEKAKGKTKAPLNIACDAVVAVSSLDHDFFITCDKCLCDCLCNIIEKHKMLIQKFKVPRVIYANPSPKEVAKWILNPP